MDTLSRLNALVGRRGLLALRNVGPVAFTIVSVFPPAISGGVDSMDLIGAAALTDFLVQFDDGALIDGRNTMTVSGSNFLELDSDN